MDATHNVSPSFLRLKQIIGDQKAKPPIQPIIPLSKTTWWNGVRAGRYPQPIKLSDNVTAWRSDNFQNLVDEICAENYISGQEIKCFLMVNDLIYFFLKIVK